MCVFVRARACTCTLVFVHARTCMCMPECTRLMHAHTCTCIHMQVHAHVCKHVYRLTGACMCVCMFVRAVCSCAFMCVHVCSYMLMYCLRQNKVNRYTRQLWTPHLRLSGPHLQLLGPLLQVLLVTHWQDGQGRPDTCEGGETQGPQWHVVHKARIRRLLSASKSGGMRPCTIQAPI